MRLTAGEILAKAADLVEFSGRWVNRYPSGHEVCMSYAIADVVQRGRHGVRMSRAENLARGAIEKEIGPGVIITSFNDAPGRTAIEVATTLRNAKRWL